ncbi:uncharacterized protein PHALS_14657 [Plasmopara halstedii]|uniref:Uncharacterized protein n=1 Tax=Plasmopara halstedii TaxID=4781 RepID=A0A0P1ANR7_PLAHL|nr:uncharacterized protein PHALS_14657 [Plasmopara halstedii]CEG42786.1 hypothetical protein PHALS_14657 [Plasmopara halstedii]|eukprot:XP_024579155.1 hypothetical protein PHALS_14657 [Plasmopara halstedii]
MHKQKMSRAISIATKYNDSSLTPIKYASQEVYVYKPRLLKHQNVLTRKAASENYADVMELELAQHAWFASLSDY